MGSQNLLWTTSATPAEERRRLAYGNDDPLDTGEGNGVLPPSEHRFLSGEVRADQSTATTQAAHSSSADRGTNQRRPAGNRIVARLQEDLRGSIRGQLAAKKGSAPTWRKG